MDFSSTIHKANSMIKFFNMKNAVVGYVKYDPEFFQSVIDFYTNKGYLTSKQESAVDSSFIKWKIPYNY